MIGLSRSRFLGVAAASVAVSRPFVARAQSAPLNLRVGATANDTYASAYYAQDMGFFTRAGLNVDLETLNNGAAIAAGIVGGALDVGVSTPIAIANAYLRGFPVVIVAAGALGSDKIRALGICVAKASGIKSPKDLEGKIVAVNVLKSGSEVSLDAWLAQGRADPGKVKVVESNFSEMGPALVRGAFAAAVISEPALTEALKAGDVVTLGDPSLAIARQYLLSCWFAAQPFAQANPEAIRRFQRAIYAAQVWANGHQTESGAILAKYAKLDSAALAAMARAPLADQLRLSDIQPFLDAAAKYGTLSRPVAAANLAYRP